VASTVTKTILIMNDNASIGQALCEPFKSEADFEVCGETENGKVARTLRSCIPT
jgi:chemotaxis response regulator CheB